MAGKYDTMQVCLNGHIITEFYDSQPDSRKNFCTECGERSIHLCTKCNRSIPGYYSIPGVLSVHAKEFPPKICANCGSKFPWHDAVTDEELGKKLEQDKKEKLQSLKGTKIEVHVKGHGNVVNLGEIIDSTIKNTIKLKNSGHNQIGLALAELTEAIKNANEIDDSVKQEHLEQLELLSKQALLPQEERLSNSILGPIINHSLPTLGAVGSIASIWSAWGDVITKFFIG